MKAIYLIDKVDENVEPVRWRNNRKRANEVIEMFNDWQIAHDFDTAKAVHLVAVAQAALRYFKEKNEGEWLVEIILDIIERTLKATDYDERVLFQAQSYEYKE